MRALSQSSLQSAPLPFNGPCRTRFKAIFEDTCHSSALRITRRRIDICSYGYSSHYGRNKNDRKCSQMLQGGRIAIREHIFSFEK